MIYSNPIICNGCCYSCDMLRFKFYLSNDKFDMHACNWDLRLPLGTKLDYFRSTKAHHYRDLFILQRDNSVIKIGFLFDWCGGSFDGHSCFLEFNPNKVCLECLKIVYDFLFEVSIFENGTIFELVRYDLAVDVPFDRNCFKLLKDRKAYQYITFGGAVTEYVGQRNNSGFVKVYDKSKESKLDYECTRIEMTFESYDIKLPDVTFECYQYDDDISETELNNTDILILELFKRLEPEEYNHYLKLVSRRKLEKIKPYITGVKNKFRFDVASMMKVMDIIEEFKKYDFKINKQDFVVDKQYYQTAFVGL